MLKLFVKEIMEINMVEFVILDSMRSHEEIMVTFCRILINSSRFAIP